MRVTGLRLVNFRNYSSLSLRPDAGLCVLTGENAAGKTNVLESLFLCSLGRSHRTMRDGEMVRSGEPFASVVVGSGIVGCMCCCRYRSRTAPGAQGRRARHHARERQFLRT